MTVPLERRHSRCNNTSSKLPRPTVRCCKVWSGTVAEVDIRSLHHVVRYRDLRHHLHLCRILSGRITAEVDRATIAEAGLDGRIVSIISNIDITAIDSFSETVSKVNTSFSSTSTSLSAYTISNRPSMKGFNEAPNAVRVLFTSGVVLGTEIVFLNGLMQVSGALNDYTVTSNPITGMLMVTFMTAPALADKVNIYGVTSGIAIPAPSVVA